MSRVESLLQPSMASMSDLVAVVVLYNSAEVVESCLRALPPRMELIVIDNASLDDGLERARAMRPDATVIRSRRNLGFGAGCNLGWRRARRPYVAFINPDVRVRRDTLQILLQRLLSVEHSMVGPALYDAFGSPRPCKHRPSAMLDICGLLPAAARWAPTGWDGRLARGHPVSNIGGNVACIEGACFVVRRADLEEIGGFDEDFFLYYEEESLAVRLALRGGDAIYEPRAAADHLGGDSTQKVAALATHHFHRSRVLFYRKRDGNVRGVLIGLLLALGMIVSWVTAAVNVALRRVRLTTPADRWHALRGVIAGMTASLTSDARYAG